MLRPKTKNMANMMKGRFSDVVVEAPTFVPVVFIPSAFKLILTGEVFTVVCDAILCAPAIITCGLSC